MWYSETRTKSLVPFSHYSAHTSTLQRQLKEKGVYHVSSRFGLICWGITSQTNYVYERRRRVGLRTIVSCPLTQDAECYRVGCYRAMAMPIATTNLWRRLHMYARSLDADAGRLRQSKRKKKDARLLEAVRTGKEEMFVLTASPCGTTALASHEVI